MFQELFVLQSNLKLRKTQQIQLLEICKLGYLKLNETNHVFSHDSAEAHVR